MDKDAVLVSETEFEDVSLVVNVFVEEGDSVSLRLNVKLGDVVTEVVGSADKEKVEVREAELEDV